MGKHKKIFYMGKNDTVAGHARRFGVRPHKVWYRVRKLGWSLDEAIRHGNANTKAKYIWAHGQRRTIADWAEVNGLTTGCIHNRLLSGWSNEDAVSIPANTFRRDHKRSRLIEFNNEIRNLSEWARHVGLTDKQLDKRLRRNWSIERALTTPLRTRGRPRPVTAFGKTQNMSEWSRETGLSLSCIIYRLDILQMEPETALRLPSSAK